VKANRGLWFRDLHYTPSGGPRRDDAAITTPYRQHTDAYYVAPNGKGLTGRAAMAGHGSSCAGSRHPPTMIRIGATYVADSRPNER